MKVSWNVYESNVGHQEADVLEFMMFWITLSISVVVNFGGRLL